MWQEEKEIGYKKHPLRGPVLMLIGMGLLVGVISSQAMDYYNEKALLSTVEQLLREDSHEPIPKETEELPISEAPIVLKKDAKSTEEQGSLLGKMKISCIDLEVPIVEGSDKNALRSAVGHMSGTSMPGSGNCVIAGHRNYSFGRFFNRLDEVQVGNQIEIETALGQRYIYEVSRVSIVEPEDVSVLEQSKDATLTLITCTPIYIASHRLIVEAKLIE